MGANNTSLSKKTPNNSSTQLCSTRPSNNRKESRDPLYSLKVYHWDVDSLGDFAKVPLDITKIIVSCLEVNPLCRLNQVCKGIITQPYSFF